MTERVRELLLLALVVALAAVGVAYGEAAEDTAVLIGRTDPSGLR